MTEDPKDDPIVENLGRVLDFPAGAAERLAATALGAPRRSKPRRTRKVVIAAAAIVALAVWWRGNSRSRPASRITNSGEVVLAVGRNGERWLISGSGARRGPEGMVLISKGGTQ